MSATNSNSNFYVIQNEDSKWSLYNSLTDKKILTKVSKSSVIFFLEMNAPSHPFIKREMPNYPAYTIDNNSGYYLNHWSYHSHTIHPYGEDICPEYNVTYNNDSQLSFDFMSDPKPATSAAPSTKNKSDSSIPDNDVSEDIPFLPEDN